MSKKRASSPDGQPSTSKLQQPRTSKALAAEDSDGLGEFEDRFEDEYESEDVLSNEEDEADEDTDVVNTSKAVNSMDIDGERLPEEKDSIPYLPQLGQGNKSLEEGEELVPDLSSYIMLHHARLAWPCLSFDILRDVMYFRNFPLSLVDDL